MSAAEAVAAEISEPWTRAEICARHPDEWVVIAEIDYIHPGGLEFCTARVVGHGKTRRAAFAQALTPRERFSLFANFYTGHIAVRPPRPSFLLDDETRDAIHYRR